VSQDVPVASLQVGDIISLPSQHGPQPIVITVVTPRTGGIKFNGRHQETGATWSFGMKYDQVVQRTGTLGENSADRLRKFGEER
jgi:hypothetical protein